MKRVLLTVGAGLVAGRRHPTQRSLATALARHTDLWVIPLAGYDWRGRRLRAYRRLPGGRFVDAGWLAPAADLWLVYSDGYELDPSVFGFARRRDFFRAQLEFHQEATERGAVGRVINSPAVEARTLKSWLATLEPARDRVMATHRCASLDEVAALRRSLGAVVAKLDWGGAGLGAHLLADDAAVRRFGERLAADPRTVIADYCFQPYRPGPEKRLWFVGGRCVAGRICCGRATPWSERSPRYAVSAYTAATPGFEADLRAAENVCRLAGLEIGSVDFIGDAVNEINGAGTIFTEYRDWDCIVDARPALVRHVVAQVRAL